MAYRTTGNLRQQTWESKLWQESQEQDFISGMVGTYNDKEQRLVDSAIMRVNLQPGANTHTIGMLLDLVGSGRQGAGKVLVGFTEALVTRNYTVRANDVRHGVDTEQYGHYAHLNEKYGILKAVNPLIARWLSARRGKHARQAMVELVSDNLEEAPHSLTSGWNKNWLVKNVGHSSQPSYDSTLASFDSNIQNALNTAGTTSAAQVDVQFFTDLQYFITTQWKMTPFDDGTYVVTVPSRQAVYLKRLNATDESIANYMKDANVAKYVEAAYGQYLMKIGRLHLIEDERAPILDYSTTNGTLTTYYRDVGATDDRSSHVNVGSTTRIFDVGMVFGKSGLTETISMRPRYDDDITDFNRLRSIGVSTTYGFQATEFDADTGTDSTRINQNSGVWCAYSGSATA